jgi:nicotinamidase-related amidase
MASVLLLVDVQKNMLLPPEPVPDADSVAVAIEEVLERARSAGAVVVHIRNNGGEGDPDAPGVPGWELVH